MRPVKDGALQVSPSMQEALIGELWSRLKQESLFKKYLKQSGMGVWLKW
jgi:hypothetical protein